MKTPPFHRRVLPWLFGITFLIVAPAVIFYTSGYRYDTKKGKVERNGTVIIDSKPTQATLFIDGREFDEKSPVTIQNVAPGLHRFELSKEGYVSWSKSLEISPERVTFADKIRLWPIREPELLKSGTTTRLSVSPDENTLLTISSASPTIVAAYELPLFGDVKLSTPILHLFPRSIQVARPIWSPSEDLVTLETEASTSSSWLLNALSTEPPAEAVGADFRFRGSALEGSDGTSLLVPTLNDPKRKIALPKDMFDRFGGHSLHSTAASTRRVYISPDFPNRGLLLPAGDWTFWNVERDYALFRDGNNWLSVVVSDKEEPRYHLAKGDSLREFAERKRVRELLVNGTELWLWTPQEDPELLYRLSEPILQAAWHEDGNDVFFMTKNTIYVLNLDVRDGRILTKLATFDELHDIAPRGKELLIAGKNGGREGIWKLKLD